jgi:hypothetical protein
MSTAVGARTPADLAEIERITAAYKRDAYEKKSPPVTMYHGDQAFCPWPNCGLVIRVFAFNGWDRAWPEPTRERLLRAFWLGSGVIARCPHCARHVLFSLEEKQTVSDPAHDSPALLPEDWLAVGMIGPRTVEVLRSNGR